MKHQPSHLRSNFPSTTGLSIRVSDRFTERRRLNFQYYAVGGSPNEHLQTLWPIINLGIYDL